MKIYLVFQNDPGGIELTLGAFVNAEDALACKENYKIENPLNSYYIEEHEVFESYKQFINHEQKIKLTI